MTATESDSFPVGSHVTIHLTDGTSMSLQIIKPLLPFTKSQVYLVRLEPAVNGLPSEVILKVFDPRYLDDRIPPPNFTSPPRLWSLEAETEAVRYRQEIVDGKHPEFTDDLLYSDEEAEPYLWEEHFYRLLKDCWESEVNALSRLESLQGTVVPKLHASGNIIPPGNTRSIQPLAVLIEYIHGTQLADIDTGMIPPEIFLPLLEAVRKFADLGVCHADINDHNILLSPSKAPTRAVLIDFGCAAVRRDGVSDEDWSFNAEFFGDERCLRRALKQKGIDILDTVPEQAESLPS